MLTKQEISQRYNAEVWKAKYELLASEAEPKHVEAAERLVEAAVTLATQSSVPFRDVVESLALVACKFKAAEKG